MAELNHDEIKRQLEKLNSGWSLEDSQLVKTFSFDDFSAALGFVVRVGVEAEAQNHHPTIELTWGKVTVHLTTHDVGGVSQKDFKLARAIEAIDSGT